MPNSPRGLALESVRRIEPGWLIEELYDRIGTAAILVALEALHRRDAQRTGEDLNQAGDHTYVAGALRAARVVSDDAATRLRRKVGA